MKKDLIYEKQEELLALYSKCLSNHAVFLAVHGIQDSKEDVALGVKLRSEIAELKMDQAGDISMSIQEVNNDGSLGPELIKQPPDLSGWTLRRIEDILRVAQSELEAEQGISYEHAKELLQFALYQEGIYNKTLAELVSLKQTIIESKLYAYFPEREMLFHDKVVFAINAGISQSKQENPDGGDYETLIKNFPRDLLMMIKDDLRNGRRLAAVKKHFYYYGSKSLKESKRIVDIIYQNEFKNKIS